MKSVIVSPSMHKGLGTDIALLSAALGELGVAVRARRPNGPERTLLGELAQSRKARVVGGDRLALWFSRVARQRNKRRAGDDAVTFLLESVHPADARIAGPTVLLPNPEWLMPDTEWQLPLLDVIACKTHDAVRVFRERGYDPFYLGFTARDLGGRARPLASALPRFLHVASTGTQKGTREVIAAWSAHPEWPMLTLLAGALEIDLAPLPNVRVIRDWVSPNGFAELMRAHDVHLCCSNSEGFGHTIVEAMSCAALVVSTDAAPMNELVTEDRGLLVRTRGARPLRLGQWHTLDERSLVDAIERAIQLPEPERLRRRRAARAWYEANDRAFRERLAQLLARVTPGGLTCDPGPRSGSSLPRHAGC